MAARLDLLAPAQIADDVLARPPARVDALDETDVRVPADALVAETHGRLPPIASAIRPKMQQKSRLTAKNLASDVSSARFKTPEFHGFQTPHPRKLLKMG